MLAKKYRYDYRSANEGCYRIDGKGSLEPGKSCNEIAQKSKGTPQEDRGGYQYAVIGGLENAATEVGYSQSEEDDRSTESGY